IFVNVGRAQGDGALMPDVPAKTKNLNGKSVAGFRMKLIREWHRRAVIDEQDAQLHVRSGEDTLQVLQKLLGRSRVVVNRRHDHKSINFRLFQSSHYTETTAEAGRN